ncbi:hypothetical protein ABPG73_005325 [Tetrahymena malaccensis]
MIQKVCLSPWCEDTDRIIIGQQIKNISLHKHDESYIVSFQDITQKKQCFLDIFSKFKRKLSDFTFLLLTTQNSLKNIQVYQKNYNDIHHFMIKQCLKISQYYESFHKNFIEQQVRSLIIQYDQNKENKKSILMQINEILSIDHILEKRVYEKIMDQFKQNLNSDELKLFNDQNKEQFKKFFEQKCNKIIEMRSELIRNLLQEYVQLSQDSNSNYYCLQYFQKLTIICNQEQQVLTYLQNLIQKQNYCRELKLLEDFKSKLIESLLFLVDFFSSQYDVQSTFQCFYEIYSLEIQNKDIFDQMIKTLKKFDVNYQERIVQTLSLITFFKNKQVLEEFFDKLFPTFQNKNNLVDKIYQLSDQPDVKDIFQELQKVFQNELNDQQLNSLIQKLLHSNCINSLIQKFFLSFLIQLKNTYFTKGIPSGKMIKDSINFQDVFSYTLQKQAERKEKNILKENEKKKLEQEKALERKNRRNNQEKKFENFRQLAKQRRNLLGFLLQTDTIHSNLNQEKNDTQQSQYNQTVEQKSQTNEDKNFAIEDTLESIHVEYECQRPCLQNSLFSANTQIMQDSKLIDSYQDVQKCSQDQQGQLVLPEQKIQKSQAQEIQMQDITVNDKLQDSLQYLIKEQDETYSEESLCQNLCEDPFDQESFLRLFNNLNNEQLVQLCKKYKLIMTQTLSKREIYSQLLNFFSASSYYYLDKLQYSKIFLEQQLKFNFNDPQRFNQLGFIQFFNKQSDCSIQNSINSIQLCQNRSQWFIHAQLGFLFQYVFENHQKAFYHYEVSMNLKFTQLSFFILFQMGYIYYHNLSDYYMALILFNQGFQFIKNNNLFDLISNSYLAQLILDYSFLNYRTGNLEKCKYLLKNFFDQNPTQNLEIAYYLNALIHLKLGDYLKALNQLQTFSESQNVSIIIESHILRGFIYLYYLKDLNLSKQQYQHAWQILCHVEIQDKLDKQIRVLKKLIQLNDGIGFYQEGEYNFIKNLQRNVYISYLEFLFAFAVQKYNECINLIICYHYEEQTENFNDNFTKNKPYYNSLIQLFQNCFDNNYRKIESMFMIGKCYQDLLGQDQQSLQSYTLVLKLDPFHHKSMLQMLTLLVNNQNYDQANIILQKIENLQFQSPQKTYLKAKMLLSQGQFQLSQSLYLQLINSQNILLSKSFYKIIQQDYSLCQYMIKMKQENQISKYIQ